MNDIPAFPTGIFTNEKGVIIGGSNGMTLRDYFAAKAMQGFCASAEEGNDITVVPTLSYEMADAMLEARNGSQ